MSLTGIDWLRGQPRLILRGQRMPRPRTACTAQLGRYARRRGRRAGLGWRAHGSCGGAVSLTGRAQRAERRRGGSPTEAGAEEGERAPVWERRRLAQLAVAAAELEGRGAEESSAGAPAPPIRRCWGREKAWGAGAAGGARDDGGGIELRRSLSSVRRRGLELRAARAMDEFAPAQVATAGAAPGKHRWSRRSRGPRQRALRRRTGRAPPLTAPAHPSPRLLPPRRRRIGGAGARPSSPRLRAPQAPRR